jgi:signal transduction histidine kinase/HAMP domain-containing protein
MKITTRLRLLLLAPILFGFIVALTQSWQTRQLSMAEHEKQVSDELIRHTLELELLLGGLIRHPEEKRTMEQWMNKHKSVAIFLSKAEVSSENQEAFDRLYKLFTALRQLHTDRNWKAQSAEVTGMSKYLEDEKSYEQMLIITSQLLTESLSYGQKTAQKVKDVRNMANFIMLFCATGTALALAILSFFLGKRILYSMKVLKNGSEAIGTGNLDFRLERLGSDEFGDLANSFNDMTEKLKSITASRDELNHEIIERKEAEKLLRQNQQYLRKVLDSQSSIVVINEDEHLIDTNKAFFNFFGKYDSIESFREEHKCICEFFETVDRSEFLTERIGDKSWIEILSTEQDILHKVMIKKGEEEHIFAVQMEGIVLEGERRNIITFTDITELENYQRTLEQKVIEELEKRRQKEAQILQQTKTAQMGEMITNITHHWRQPLNIIGLHVQELQDAERYGELDATYLNDVVDKTMRELTKMSDTLDKFRSFVALDQQKKVFNLANAITKTIELINPALQSHFVTLETKLNDTIQFYGNENTLWQVLYNILLNALEALKASKTEEKKIFVTLGSNSENFAIITVKDNAGGIDESIISRIFDPFFTTKGNANKTGTGLYFAKNMVEIELGGHIDVVNEESGALFMIGLPISNIESTEKSRWAIN